MCGTDIKQQPSLHLPSRNPSAPYAFSVSIENLVGPPIPLESFFLLIFTSVLLTSFHPNAFHPHFCHHNSPNIFCKAIVVFFYDIKIRLTIRFLKGSKQMIVNNI